MADNNDDFIPSDIENKTPEIVFKPEKDFYKGMRGELRFKAEGLFKKAKEKGISIEEINITTLGGSEVDVPGLGIIELPSYFIKVKGKDLTSGQEMADGKLIDYYNRYLKYTADKIEDKNVIKGERGRPKRDAEGKMILKGEIEFLLTDWEKFEVAKNLVDDKEFGLEKTITGACDRVIRKLMGENDWLYPEEARLLDEEFNNVQTKISEEREEKRQMATAAPKKATERQINYLKSKIKNYGLNPDGKNVMEEILRQLGYENGDISNLSTIDVSKIIDGIGNVIPRVKEVIALDFQKEAQNQSEYTHPGGSLKQ